MSASSIVPPDAVFAPASAGARVRLATMLSIVIVIVLVASLFAAMMLERQAPPWPAFGVIGVAPLVVGAIWFTAHIRNYRVTASELLVELPLRKARFPLPGLQGAEPDRDAFRGARKIVGNDGLRAITGRFRSERLGRFHAYVTDTERAVVLRWPDRCLVISPQQSSLFVETVRKRAGLIR